MLAALALVVALGALALAGATWTSTRASARAGDGAEPTDVRALRAEVAALAAEGSDGLRHVAVVRYDAFGDVGGHLSWSLVLADDGGDGVVLTSIHGRSDARAYAKSLTGWRSEQQLSPEEEQAVERARP
ncbi:MAG: hypothetical protein CMH83_04950 [Nocardioides sp.]|nr:hypothetical protein [Nocardioides sp.]